MSGFTAPSGLLGGVPDHRFTCSRVGCRDAATTALLWRNPKIHAAERRKTWLACEAHVAVLQDFLETRDFPLELKPVDEIDERPAHD